MAKKTGNTLTLIGLDTEGDWNLPLIENAADISDAALEYAFKEFPPDKCAVTDKSRLTAFEDLLPRFDTLLACETGTKSKNIYKFPAVRGNTALLVGNEMEGMSQDVLHKVDQVISIPMYGERMSSVNVATAAATSLYILSRDLARKRVKRSKTKTRDVDILLHSPEDPSELGSLLRSVWAFGWKKVYVSDDNQVWFTKDKEVIMAGRAAARQEKNPIVVAPVDQIRNRQYETIVVCTDDRAGTPLSRLVLPDSRRMLITYGESDISSDSLSSCLPRQKRKPLIQRVYVDFVNRKVKPCYRHTGSSLLSVLSQMLRR